MEQKTVRCKFYIKAIEMTKYNDGEVLHAYKLSAVYGDSEENKKFWRWTPSGEMTLGTVRPQPGWVLGAEVYLDISIAEPVAA